MDKEDLNGKGEFILVIDDEEQICNLTAEMLEKFKYIAICKNLFSDAVEYFRDNQHKVKLIIMDYTIPGESAEEAVRRFREINPDVLIIVISGFLASNDMQDNIKLLNVDLAIQKPFEMVNFIREVKNILK